MTAPAPAIESACSVHYGMDLISGTFQATCNNGATVASDEECSWLCTQCAPCTAWVTDSPVSPGSHYCWLTSGSVAWESASERTGGIRCESAKAPTPAPAPAPAPALAECASGTATDNAPVITNAPCKCANTNCAASNLPEQCIIAGTGAAATGKCETYECKGFGILDFTLGPCSCGGDVCKNAVGTATQPVIFQRCQATNPSGLRCDLL
jgi:hypothetical protein